MRKLLLASPTAGVGKTTAAINLAASAALAGRRALLADCDPARGAIAALGLGSARATLEAIGITSPAPLWRDAVAGLDVTSPYDDANQPIHTLEEFLELVRRDTGFQSYSVVLFDTPPVLASTQMAALLRTVDDAILVIRAVPAALRDVHPFLQLVKRIQDEERPLQFRGLLLTLPPGEPIGGSWETELRRAFAMSLLPHTVPHDPEMDRATARGQPIVAANPHSAAARQYTALAQLLGLAPTEGESVELFPTPIPAANAPQSLDQVRGLLGDDVKEVAESLSRITRAAGLPRESQAGAPASEDRNMSLPEYSGAIDQPSHRHTGDITAVAFKPDGRTIATGSWDKTVKLWDVQTAAELATFAGHGGVISSIAFSPDGSLLATTSWDKTARLWRVATGETTATLKGHAGVVTAAAFAPRGDLIATGGWDKAVRLWRANGDSIGVLTGHVRMVTSVAVGPDGRTIASGSWDRTIKLWDADSLTCTTTLLGHTGDVTSVAISPDGRRIASGSLDHTIRFWDPSSGRELNALRGHGGEVNCVAFSPDGRRVASSSWDRTIKVWDVETGQLLMSLVGHSGVVTSVAFSQDGRSIASSSLDRSVKIWDASTGDERATIRVQSSNEARASGPFNPRETPPTKGPAAEETKISPPSQTPTPVPGTIPSPVASLPVAPRLPTAPQLPVPQTPKPPIETPVPPRPAVAVPTTPPVRVQTPQLPTTVGTPTPSRPIVVTPTTPPVVVQSPTPQMTRRSPTPPVAPPPPPVAPPLPTADDSFVDTWTGPSQMPLLADILGPSIGPKPFFPAPPIAPTPPTRPTPQSGGATSLRFGDLSPTSPPMPVTPEPAEPTEPTIPTTEVHLPDLPVAPTTTPTLRFADLTPGVKTTAEAPKSVALPEIKIVAPGAIATSEIVASESPLASREAMDTQLPEMPEDDEGVSVIEVTIPEVTVGAEGSPGTGYEINLPNIELPPSDEEELMAAPGPDLEMVEGDATDMELPVHPPPATPQDEIPEAIPDVRLPAIAIPESADDAGVELFPTTAAEAQTDLPIAVPVPAVADMSTVEPPPVAPSAPPIVRIPDLAMPVDAVIAEEASSATKPEIVIPINEPVPVKKAPPAPVRRSPERPARGAAFNALAVSPDGSLVAATRGDASVLVWHAATGEMLQALHGHSGEVTALAFSPDGAVLAAGGADKIVRLWEVANGAEFKVLTGHSARVTAVTFSPDDLHIATAGWDGSIHIWEWVSGMEEFVLPGNSDGIAALAYSPDGLALVAGGEDGTVRLWNLEGRSEVLRLAAHQGEVAAVAYAADGERFASVGGDGFVRIWDAGSGEEWLSIQAHLGACSAVAFASEADLLATAGRDFQVKLWNANSGQALRTLVGHKAEVTGLAFAPDGKTLISSGWDRTVRFWDPFAGIETGTLTEQGFVPRSAVRITPPRLTRPDLRSARPGVVPPRAQPPIPPPPAPLLPPPPVAKPAAPPAPLPNPYPRNPRRP